jgi:hypothetical protein
VSVSQPRGNGHSTIENTLPDPESRMLQHAADRHGRNVNV